MNGVSETGRKLRYSDVAGRSSYRLLVIPGSVGPFTPKERQVLECICYMSGIKYLEISCAQNKCIFHYQLLVIPLFEKVFHFQHSIIKDLKMSLPG